VGGLLRGRTDGLHSILATDQVGGPLCGDSALTVILRGNETLTRKFGLSVLESLATSITVTISVESLSVEESLTYIEGRISACGQKAPLFTKNAMTLIHQASGGILRTIGTIASAALLKAFLGSSKQVETEHVQSVIQR
jgi:type II secretory pathway predicted ATPase ExeA